MNIEYLGGKIRTLRKLRNMTQSELTGDYMTRNMLSRIENGSATPSIESLLFIAEKLDISPGWLLDNETGFIQYEKSNKIGRIKTLFAKKEYSICEQECTELLSDGGDDELYLIAAESAYNIALENFGNGKLVSADAWFTKSMEHNSAGNIKINALNESAKAYINYIKVIFSNSRLREDYSGCVLSKPFPPYEGAVCIQYNILIKKGNTDIVRSAVETGEINGIYSEQISAALLLAENDFDGAEEKYKKLMRSDELPIEIDYLVCSELEKISRLKDNYKLAYTCADKKLELIKRAGK